MLLTSAELSICTRGQLMKKEAEPTLGEEMACKILPSAFCTWHVLFPALLSVVEQTQQPLLLAWDSWVISCRVCNYLINKEEEPGCCRLALRAGNPEPNEKKSELNPKQL